MPERVKKLQNAALKMQSRNPTGLITEMGKLFYKCTRQIDAFPGRP